MTSETTSIPMKIQIPYFALNYFLMLSKQKCISVTQISWIFNETKAIKYFVLICWKNSLGKQGTSVNHIVCKLR